MAGARANDIAITMANAMARAIASAGDSASAVGCTMGIASALY